MTKILGCFTLRHTEPKLPWEIRSMIVKYLRSTQLEYILEKYPNVRWDWDEICKGNVSFKFVMKTDFPWEWYLALCGNPNITIEQILLIDEVISLYDLVKNPNFKLKHVLESPYDDWDWRGISKNKNITIEQVIEHDFPWNWYCLSSRLLVKDIFDNPNLPWDWNGISKNKTLTMKHIKKNIHKINWHELSNNPNITFEFIIKNKKEDWNWYRLSQHPNIKMEHIINNDLRWDIMGLEETPNVTCPEIFKYIKSTIFLSENPAVTIQDIYKYKECWDYCSLSYNPNVTFDFVKDNINKKWDLTGLVLNPNLTTKEKIKICELT